MTTMPPAGRIRSDVDGSPVFDPQHRSQEIAALLAFFFTPTMTSAAAHRPSGATTTTTTDVVASGSRGSDHHRLPSAFSAPMSGPSIAAWCSLRRGEPAAVMGDECLLLRPAHTPAESGRGLQQSRRSGSASCSPSEDVPLIVRPCVAFVSGSSGSGKSSSLAFLCRAWRSRDVVVSTTSVAGEERGNGGRSRSTSVDVRYRCTLLTDTIVCLGLNARAMLARLATSLRTLLTSYLVGAAQGGAEEGESTLTATQRRTLSTVLPKQPAGDLLYLAGATVMGYLDALLSSATIAKLMKEKCKQWQSRAPAARRRKATDGGPSSSPLPDWADSAPPFPRIVIAFDEVDSLDRSGKAALRDVLPRLARATLNADAALCVRRPELAANGGGGDERHHLEDVPRLGGVFTVPLCAIVTVSNDRHCDFETSFTPAAAAAVGRSSFATQQPVQAAIDVAFVTFAPYSGATLADIATANLGLGGEGVCAAASGPKNTSATATMREKKAAAVPPASAVPSGGVRGAAVVMGRQAVMAAAKLAIATYGGDARKVVAMCRQGVLSALHKADDAAVVRAATADGSAETSPSGGMHDSRTTAIDSLRSSSATTATKVGAKRTRDEGGVALGGSISVGAGDIMSSLHDSNATNVAAIRELGHHQPQLLFVLCCVVHLYRGGDGRIVSEDAVADAAPAGDGSAMTKLEIERTAQRSSLLLAGRSSCATKTNGGRSGGNEDGVTFAQLYNVYYQLMQSMRMPCSSAASVRELCGSLCALGLLSQVGGGGDGSIGAAKGSNRNVAQRRLGRIASNGGTLRDRYVLCAHVGEVETALKADGRFFSLASQIAMPVGAAAIGPP